MTNTLAVLRTRNADMQSIVNFTLLLLTLMLAGYFGLVSLEHSEMVRAV